jgi:hypothetical protein
MPWTIPNQLLHDRPVPLANMRTHGRRHVFVCCSNPDCHHNAELDVSRHPDDVTFNDLQPRMLCTACDHRGADGAKPISEYDSSKEKHWERKN